MSLSPISILPISQSIMVQPLPSRHEVVDKQIRQIHRSTALCPIRQKNPPPRNRAPTYPKTSQPQLHQRAPKPRAPQNHQHASRQSHNARAHTQAATQHQWDVVASVNAQKRSNPGVLQGFARIVSRGRRSQQSCLRGNMLPRCTNQD